MIRDGFKEAGMGVSWLQSQTGLRNHKISSKILGEVSDIFLSAGVWS
jgi:hypothetical protein